MTNDLYEQIKSISERPTQPEIDFATSHYSNYNPSYVWEGIRTDIRKDINQRWIAVREFSEKNFPIEFRETGKHNSKLFELNIRYLLRNKLIRAPKDREPDIIGNNFFVECVEPAPNGVPQPTYDGKLYDYPSDQISRRVTAALTSKLDQLQQRIDDKSSALDLGSTPYIIGIGLTDPKYLSARHMNGMDITEAVLIGAGPLQITVNSENNTGKFSIATQDSIVTAKGKSIPTAYFQRDEWKKVSAVMWTSEWLPNEHDVTIMLNPNAEIPFDVSAFGIDINVITYSNNGDSYSRNQPLA